MCACCFVSDVSTDGIWCYIVLWVLPHTSSLTVRWSNLKNCLLSICPSSCSVAFYLNQQPASSSASPVYLLKFLCLDRKELLHGKSRYNVITFLLFFLCFSIYCLNLWMHFSDVTQVLCELELTIQRVKVTTTPDERVLDLFFITDNM